MWNNDTTTTISTYGEWMLRDADGGGYEVFKGEEVHKVSSLHSANFLRKLFNEQDQWFNWGRHGINNTITLSSTDGLSIGSSNGYAFHNPPKANVKLFFGDSEQEYATYFQFYLKKPPNCIQRWLLAKTFGIKMVLLK